MLNDKLKNYIPLIRQKSKIINGNLLRLNKTFLLFGKTQKNIDYKVLDWNLYIIYTKSKPSIIIRTNYLDKFIGVRVKNFEENENWNFYWYNYKYWIIKKQKLKRLYEIRQFEKFNKKKIKLQYFTLVFFICNLFVLLKNWYKLILRYKKIIKFNNKKHENFKNKWNIYLLDLFLKFLKKKWKITYLYKMIK